MGSRRLLAGIVILQAAAVLAQTGPPAFEVLSIRPAPDVRAPRHMYVSRGKIDFSNVPLREMVVAAYQMEHFQIEFPSWMSKRFNVKANMPAGASVEDLPAMLQSMLENRFRLTAHREMRTQKVWLLEVAENGHRLQKTAGAVPKRSDLGRIPLSGSAGEFVMTLVDADTVHVAIQRGTMAALCRFLATNLHRPVLDKTGIEGEYDIDFDASVTSPVDLGASPGPMPAPPGPPSVAVVPALKRLGLRMRQSREAVEFLVIDSGQQTPAEQ